jgi:hypothetical protein
MCRVDSNKSSINAIAPIIMRWKIMYIL